MRDGGRERSNSQHDWEGLKIQAALAGAVALFAAATIPVVNGMFNEAADQDARRVIEDKLR